MSTETMPTPGPWKVEPPTTRVRAWQIVTAHGFPTYVGSASHSEASEENARLMAAAPELLAELRNIAEAKRFNKDYFDDDASFADWAQSRARWAIAKAEGDRQ